MNKHGMKYEYLSLALLQKKFPLINPRGLHHAYLDPHAGFLRARESSEVVVKSFVKEGGEFIQAFALPSIVDHHRMESINLSNGSSLRANAFVFAMGAWMGKFFPKELGAEITCTKQEVFYFEIPTEHARTCASMPVWIDADGKDFYYGIPASPTGFKVGVDRRGEDFDPSQVDRTGSPDVLKHTREFLSHRFPALSQARLVEARVCPYENSSDGNFIFKSHPHVENVVFLGGGSGHGFKHGPALGEYVAQALIA
jgi:glycine/D-amino acid oxidase-like deaminating enzyme